MNLIAKRKALTPAKDNSLLQNSVDYFQRLDIGTAQIKDASITDAKIVTLDVGKLTAGTISSKSIVLAVSAGTGDTEIRAGIATGDFANTGAANGFILGLDDSDSDKPKFFIGGGSNYMKWDGAALTVTAPVITSIAAGTDPAIQGWTSNLVFSASDADTVAWAIGTVTLTDGTTYSITAGNTGNMAALTYIYLDPVVSATVLQTSTTAANAVGAKKILLATAQNNAAGSATFQVYGGGGGTVIKNANISDCAINKLTAGTISSKAITLAITAGTGDSYIAAGKTDFTNTNAGFILGLDDSDSDKAKFYIGDSTHYLNWTGAALNIYGGTLTVGGGSVIMDATGICVKGTAYGSGVINIQDADAHECGAMWGFDGTSNQVAIIGAKQGLSLTAGAISVGCNTGEIYLRCTDEIIFGPTNNIIRPDDNVTTDCGTASNRWNSVYAQNHIIGGEGDAESIEGNIAYSWIPDTYVFAVYENSGWRAVELT